MASDQPAKRKDPVRIVCEAALALCVVAACMAIFAQVFYRYVLDDPVSWLDEFAVFMFAWIIMLGAAMVTMADSAAAYLRKRRAKTGGLTEPARRPTTEGALEAS